MANLYLPAEDAESSAFDPPRAVLFEEAGMPRIRKAKPSRRKRIKAELEPNLPPEMPAWQSVIAEAEEQITQLRRTIEKTKQYTRSHPKIFPISL